MAWLIIILLSSICSWFFPWWTNIIVAFLAGLTLFPATFKRSFLTGGISIALVWVSLSFWMSWNNDFILVQKVTSMLSLPHVSLVFVVQAFLALLIGGFSCSSGLAVSRLYHLN